MRQSLRALLADVIDYAGLFPPARLPLEPAIRNFAAYRASADRWMLARFVIPAAQLAALATWVDDLFPVGSAARFCVLVGGGQSVDEFGQMLRADVEAMAKFVQRHGDRVSIGTLEVRLPADVAGVVQAPAAALGEYVEAIGGSQLSEIAAFFEVPAHPEWENAARATIATLRAPAAGAVHAPRLGFKLRTGGIAADAFPSVERVAQTIVDCRNAGIPLKFTAGLHHPLRSYRGEVQTHMHGFINVLVACVMAQLYSLDPLSADDLCTALRCEDPRAFEFHDDGLVFNQHPANLTQIATTRREFAISFGSCSFDEPREDLTALGWW